MHLQKWTFYANKNNFCSASLLTLISVIYNSLFFRSLDLLLHIDAMHCAHTKYMHTRYIHMFILYAIFCVWIICVSYMCCCCSFILCVNMLLHNFRLIAKTNKSHNYEYEVRLSVWICQLLRKLIFSRTSRNNVDNALKRVLLHSGYNETMKRCPGQLCGIRHAASYYLVIA